MQLYSGKEVEKVLGPPIQLCFANVAKVNISPPKKAKDGRKKRGRLLMCKGFMLP
jgi:hypothetical protein